MAALNSLCNRMYNIPLNNTRLNIEKSKVLEIGKINAYRDILTKKVINKYEKKHNLKIVTTLTPIVKEPIKRIKLTYFPKWTIKLKNVIKSSNCAIASTSQNKLKNYIAKNKDKVNINDLLNPIFFV